jgi:Bacterial Ig domain/RTX calcium-binding nonapeptide repeat (4 copies)
MLMSDTDAPMISSFQLALLVACSALLSVAVPAVAAERIDGTSGADTIDVSTSSLPHEIYGLGGYDTVYGSSASDYIDGGAGKDEIHGNDGDDVLAGGAQPDTIYGGNGDDTFAMSGDRDDCDWIDGNAGTDTLQGSSGDDILCVISLKSVERIDGGAGNDVLAMANGGASLLDLSAMQVLGVELIRGSRSGDSITGSSGADRIAGDAGSDTIDGGPGQDTANFSGPLQSYEISVDGNTLIVKDLVGRDRTDTLTNIEFLEFADRIVPAGNYLPTDPDNAEPLARDDSASVDEDHSVEIDVLWNDTDPDGDQLYIGNIGNTLNGQAVLTEDGAIRYEPDRDYAGVDKFTYQIEDGRGGIATATVTVEVHAIADAPIAVDDSAETPADQPVNIDLLANDSDADRDERLEITGLSAPDHGDVAFIALGTVEYRPAPGFSGTDRFSYEIADSTGLTATAGVTVRVTGSNPPSIGSALLDAVIAAPEGSWLRVNENRFSDVWPDSTQIPYTPGYLQPAKVIFAWSSMAWDPNRDQLIFWGGGHANYSGNEIYRFDTSTLRWERASLPSDVVDLLGDKQYFSVDGPFNAPTSSHTYDNQIFLPVIDRFLTFGGAKFNGKQQFVLEDGVTLTGPYLWDPSKAGADMVGGTGGSQVNPGLYPDVIGARMWENRDTIVNSGQGAIRPSGDFVNSTTAYYPVNGKDAVFVTDAPRRGGELFRYIINDAGDPSQDAWELIGEDGTGYGNQGAGAYDASRKIFARTANTSDGWALIVWDTSNPGPQNKSFRVSPHDPNGEFRITELHGMDFDQKRGAFVLWDGGPEIWYVTPPATGLMGQWIATRAPAGDPALGPQQQDASLVTYQGKLKGQRGVLGKWEYAPDLDLFLGVVAPESGDVWVYKPVGWSVPD